MVLRATFHHPGIFIDSVTGDVINFSEYKNFEYTERLADFSTQPITPQNEDWVLRKWSILLHPWPEVISSEIIVELVINGITEAETPLFSVAEPLARSENQDLRERIEAIEKRLEISEHIKSIKLLNNQRIKCTDHIYVMIKGPSKILTEILPPTTLDLHLTGMKRKLIP